MVMVLLLCGCSVKTIYFFDSKEQDRRRQVMAVHKKLLSYKVDITRDKEYIILSLPNKELFNYSSANFSNTAYKILDLILSLTKYYEVSVVSVIGYHAENSKHGGYLFAERAHKVVQYLWKSGIDANFLYSTENSVPIDRNVFKSCIVITFRKL